MFLLDFDSSASQAFLHGFVKGLAAPVSLYHVEEVLQLPKLTPLRPSLSSTPAAMRHDWVAIGGDFAAVIEKKSKHPATAKP